MSAIENDSHAASYDEVATIIERAAAISVGPCSCRRSRRLMGEKYAATWKKICACISTTMPSTSPGTAGSAHQQGGSI